MRFIFGANTGSSLSSAARFFLLDDLAELGFGVGASLGVFGSELVGANLRVCEILGELLGLRALAAKIGALLFKVCNDRVQFIGCDRAGAESDTGKFVALHDRIEIGGVFEQRSKWSGPGTDERADCHLTQVAAQLTDFGFFGSDASFRFHNLAVEHSFCVDGEHVFLADPAGIFFEPFELVNNVFDASALRINRAGV